MQASSSLEQTLSMIDLPEGIHYQKIFTAGHEVPSDPTILSFKRVVNRFLQENEDNVFNQSRGHSIERENYLQDLKSGPKRSNQGMDQPDEEPVMGPRGHRPNDSLLDTRMRPPFNMREPFYSAPFPGHCLGTQDLFVILPHPHHIGQDPRGHTLRGLTGEHLIPPTMPHTLCYPGTTLAKPGDLQMDTPPPLASLWNHRKSSRVQTGSTDLGSTDRTGQSGLDNKAGEVGTREEVAHLRALTIPPAVH
ncbi:hypothetical protein JZ751_012123 [Albula glossodonta]|uniref:Uncharacterized protein n=1 Tax=Albula glossodonta TaxID=121402 RepID=A0A8T2PRP8_9TELE|nr:hypothetical protein JZ751_012123 [Albula glossodonta]